MDPYAAELATALGHHQAGRLAAAAEIYRRVLHAAPEHADAWHLAGVVHLQSREYPQAVQAIERAIRLKPAEARFHNNLGEAYRALGQLPDAITAYRRALEIDPAFAGAYYNLANVLKQTGESEAAITAYEQAIELQSDYAAAYNNLGNLLKSLGRLADAVAVYRRGLCNDPWRADARSNLKLALEEQQRQAGAEYRQANALRERGQFAEAAAAYRRALVIQPDHADAHNNLGATLKELGQRRESALCFAAAIRCRPDYAEAHSNLGGAYWEQGDLDRALACLERALELKPDYHEAHFNLGVILKDRGQAAEAVACFRRALEIRPDFAAAYGNLLYVLYFCDGYDARAIYQEHRRWAAQYERPLRPHRAPHANERSPERRLRIGYVSPDFRRHPVGRFIAPLLAAHDAAQFEVYCYASLDVADEVTEACRAAAGVWRPVRELSDAQLAEAIRDDRIDILVDLTMHMAGSRLLAFARRPAPVQVTYLAYVGTTGLDTIDYRLTDPYLDPPEQAAAQGASAEREIYSEQSFRLPETYWCYRPPPGTPPVNPPLAAAGGLVTFGCFNNFCKVTDATLETWGRLLRAVPRSRLVLHAAPGGHRQRVSAFLARQGVSPERIEFVGFLPSAEYFRLYHSIDLVLDPFPYGGGTTTCDALWMGVPVVSLVGQTAVGRGGLSILSNVGLAELAGGDREHYLRIATELAGDARRLGELRTSLRERMQASPLMNAPRFAGHVEAAYRQMWRRWAAGEARNS